MKTIVNRMFLYHDVERPLDEWTIETYLDTPGGWVLVDALIVLGSALAAWDEATMIRVACGHSRLRFFG